MNIARAQVRNILLTLVVVCAFIIDARTARATASPWPGCLPAAFDGAVAAGIRDNFPRSRAARPGPSADGVAPGCPARA
jgi:hypothetical protein